MKRKAYLQLGVYTMWGLLSAQSVFAAVMKNPARGKLDEVVQAAGVSTKGTTEYTLFETIGEMVTNAGTYILGPLLMLYLLYGGWLWMTASGDSSQVKTAQGIIRNAVAGLLILATVFAVVSFVSDFFLLGASGISGDIDTAEGAINAAGDSLFNSIK